MHFSWQSQEECEYLINLAKPHMVKSTVVDSDTGKSTDSRYDTSLLLLYFFFYLLLLLLFAGCFSYNNLSSILKLVDLPGVSTPFCLRVRTSSGTFLARGRDKTIRTIEKRIADFTFLPVGTLFTKHYGILLNH